MQHSTPYSPSKAKVGKLYELKIIPLDVEADFIQYYVFDSKGRLTDRTWTPEPRNFCLVLGRQPNDTTAVLIGENIVYLHDSEELWKIELIPLVE